MLHSIINAESMRLPKGPYHLIQSLLTVFIMDLELCLDLGGVFLRRVEGGEQSSRCGFRRCHGCLEIVVGPKLGRAITENIRHLGQRVCADCVLGVGNFLLIDLVNPSLLAGSGTGIRGSSW